VEELTGLRGFAMMPESKEKIRQAMLRYRETQRIKGQLLPGQELVRRPKGGKALSGRRHWLALWIDSWFSGSVRFKLSIEQRSIWIDLLVLAGDSRVPGVITPGETKGVLDAYPLDWIASRLRCSETLLSETMLLLEEQGRITVHGGVITICNWEAYQLPYGEVLVKQHKKHTVKDMESTRTGTSAPLPSPKGKPGVEPDKNSSPPPVPVILESPPDAPNAAPWDTRSGPAILE
jgi:hypothetical protein